MSRRATPRSRSVEDLADALHSAAIHLLRRLRRVDDETGLSPARLSALSVIVFGGPLRVTDLARAEQVRTPTITPIVASLEREGLVTRAVDEGDGRASILHATAAGRAVMARGRARRVEALTAELRKLPAADRDILRRAADLMQQVARSGRMTRLALPLAAALLAAACSSSPESATLTVGPGIEMIRIEAGTFTMGTPETEAGREDQERLHDVRLTRPFYLGVTEVTQAQWEAVMGTRPSHFGDCGGDCPVERVNFDDVQAFIARLNATAGGGFRLPTEAEWEYACRAGGRAPFGHTSTLGSADANINGTYPYGADATGPSAGTRAVASFDPNPWGLFDMSGNVWEWVEDWHCPYPTDEVVDPIGRCDSAYRVIRGGSWVFDGNSARCGLRYTHRPRDRGFSLGFRLARSAR